MHTRPGCVRHACMYLQAFEKFVQGVFDMAVMDGVAFERCHEVMKALADSWQNMLSIPFRLEITEQFDVSWNTRNYGPMDAYYRKCVCTSKHIHMLRGKRIQSSDAKQCRRICGSSVAVDRPLPVCARSTSVSTLPPPARMSTSRTPILSFRQLFRLLVRALPPSRPFSFPPARSWSLAAALGRIGHHRTEERLRERRAGTGKRAAHALQSDGRVRPLLASLAVGCRLLQRGKSCPKIVGALPPPPP